MADLFTQLTPFFSGIIELLALLLVPQDSAGATDWTAINPFQLLIWAALVFMFVRTIWGFSIGAIQRARRG
jgi:hypothetical protein